VSKEIQNFSATDYECLNLEQRLLMECEEMSKFALSNGKKIPSSLLEHLKEILDKQAEHEPLPIQELANIHDFLSEAILPATPRSIVLLNKMRSAKSSLKFLSPIPFVRRMMLATFFALFCLIATSLSPNVNVHTITEGLLSSSGLTLLINIGFILSAAALGGAFHALFLANRYVSNGSFDPKYESEYWTRFVLGLVSGMILSELLSFSKADLSTISSNQAFVKPTLAILGGFSTGAVYRILYKMVESVESLVQGSEKEKSEATTKVAVLNSEKDASTSQLKLAHSLLDLQGKLYEDKLDKHEVNQSLKNILNEATPMNLDLGRQSDDSTNTSEEKPD